MFKWVGHIETVMRFCRVLEGAGGLTLGRFWGGRRVRDRPRPSAGQEWSPRILGYLRTVEDDAVSHGPHGIQEVVGSTPIGSTSPSSPFARRYTRLASSQLNHGDLGPGSSRLTVRELCGFSGRSQAG
jgi:hypothetical protein